jgi:N6-L-threonylcarbamoyladenine synthase
VILGIETSCDETAAAVVSDDGRVLSSVVSSQADLHARFGGVVPEIASRRHLELVSPAVRAALDEADTSLDGVERVAVTQGPGLVGALLVGISAAKALAWARGVPLVPVDHLEGHIASLYLEPEPFEPPFTCLLASGGHTLLLSVRERGRSERLGTTLDDAAGEAFDKGARLLGLGYPGGAAVDLLAREGDPTAYDFPVARVAGLDFSFSGLKTALLYAVRELAPEEVEARRADLAASYQRAIVDALVARTRAALERTGIERLAIGGGVAASYQRAIVRALVQRVREAAEVTGLERIAVVGGVAANSELRAALPEAAFAPLALCTDNAAMIASCARFVEPLPYPRYRDLDAYASLA